MVTYRGGLDGQGIHLLRLMEEGGEPRHRISRSACERGWSDSRLSSAIFRGKEEGEKRLEFQTRRRAARNKQHTGMGISSSLTGVGGGGRGKRGEGYPCCLCDDCRAR